MIRFPGEVGNGPRKNHRQEGMILLMIRISVRFLQDGVILSRCCELTNKATDLQLTLI